MDGLWRVEPGESCDLVDFKVGFGCCVQNRTLGDKRGCRETSAVAGVVERDDGG